MKIPKNLLILLTSILLIASCVQKPTAYPLETDTPFVIATITPPPTSTPTYTPSPSPTPTPLPPISVSFYTIRFQYTTKSDWTRLKILNSPNILTYSIRSVSGHPYESNIYFEDNASYRIELNRPPADLSQEPSTSMTIDFAFSAEEPLDQLNLIQEKGAWNYSTLEIFLVSDDEQSLIWEGKQYAEAGNLSIDLQIVNQYKPSVNFIPQQTSEKMLWAIYYPWYQGEQAGWGGWKDPMYTDRPIDHYSSANRTSIENQIRLAQGAGIDGFIVSFSGSGQPDDTCFQNLLDYSSKTGFKIAFLIEGADFSGLTSGSWEDTAAVQTEKVENMIKYVISQYGDHPAYMQINNKPLLFLFGSPLTPTEVWMQILDKLKTARIDASFFGQGYNVTNLEIFDGAFEYGAPDSGDWSSQYSIFNKSLIYRPLLNQDTLPKFWAASVMPGFDNTPLVKWFGTWPLGIIARDNGNFYRTTFEHAIQSNADWIIITSWNEYQENTHIEPSEQFGEEYLRITAEYAERWKNP